MIIDLPRFLESERATWVELEQTLEAMAETPDKWLTYERAKRFHYLYQKVSSDLGRLSTFSSEPNLLRYLETLVARAYAEIHSVREPGPRWNPARWLWSEFPATFRRHFRAFLLSLLITVAGAAFGWGAVWLDPAAKDALVPRQFSYLSGDPARRVAEEEHAKQDRLGNHHATFAGQLMTNNIRVSLMTLAFGMTFGVMTVVMLFFNGLLIGLVAVDYIRAGQTLFLFGWLLPHGAIEIPSILIAGQAGLLLGGTMLRGLLQRDLGPRLRRAGPDIASLAGGFSVMLIWAGLVESFLSQNHQPVIPYWVKIVFGLCELAALAWWLGARKGVAETAGEPALA